MGCGAAPGPGYTLPTAEGAAAAPGALPIRELFSNFLSVLQYITVMTLLEQAQPYLEALEQRKLTVRALASILNCNESYLSRILSNRVQRIESQAKIRQKHSKLFALRKEMRKKHAILVKSGKKSLKKGAADAKCSERTLRRYIASI